jgi:hypothetical protein
VRKKLAGDLAGDSVLEAPVAFAEREELPLREARRRWAEPLRKVFQVDPLKCPNCAAEMRIVSFITEREIIDRILSHLRSRNSRAPPA